MNNKQFDPAKSLYIQIRDKIKNEILSGRLKAGQKIPSERELCEMFEVSRITIRQAINEAVKEGLLFTVQGKGTFVDGNEENKINQGLVKLTTFNDTINSVGEVAGTQILNHKMIPIDFELCKILNLEITNNILNLNLLGTADSIPVVLYKSYFESQIGLKLYEKAIDFQKKNYAFSTIDLYKKFPELIPTYVEQTFEAIIADEELSDILNVEKGAPVFLVNSIIYINENNPVEYKKAYYRANKYKFHIKRNI